MCLRKLDIVKLRLKTLGCSTPDRSIEKSPEIRRVKSFDTMKNLDPKGDALESFLDATTVDLGSSRRRLSK